MNQLERAQAVAMWAFHGKNDLAGVPYYDHCDRVGKRLKALGYDAQIQAIGYLHDVLEDTQVHMVELEKLGFSQRVLDGVDAMTQKVYGDGSKEPLDVYWDRVFANQDAAIVKLCADSVDNDDPERRYRIGVGFAERMHAKYEKLRAYAAMKGLTVDPKTGRLVAARPLNALGGSTSGQGPEDSVPKVTVDSVLND